jgi:glycosyltransferase involved in cell wall biosynthesis
VIPSVSPLRGGPSETVRSLASGLARTGIETHVATTDDNGSGRLRVSCGVPNEQDGVTYWYFPRQTRFYTFSWPLNAWLAQRVGDFDVVHIHALFSFASIPAAFWAWRSGVPYLVRPLGTLNEWGMKNRHRRLKGLSFRWIERRILGHAARVHYTTDQERLEAESLDVKTPAAVIPNALREHPGIPDGTAFLGRYPQLQGRQIILFLSRLDAIKGVNLLLQAFAQVRQTTPNVSLVIAGDGKPAFVGDLKRQAASLGLDSDVLWVGFLDEDEKRAALSEADLFVLPSYSESFGIAVAEAMAAGLAVVVSDRVAIHSDVARARAGIVSPCEAGPFADAIVRLLNDPKLRESMGKNGEVVTRQQYSSEAVTGKLISVYNEIAN